MSLSITKYYDGRGGDSHHSDDDSFESALCEMYNDVLFHTIIPEEEEFFFSCSKVQALENGDDQQGLAPLSPNNIMKRERFRMSNRESFLSLRSAAGSFGSSFMLSVGDTQDQQYDDDLSYMTENDAFEERAVSVNFEQTDEFDHPEDERYDNFEERMVCVKFEDTKDCDREIQLQCSRVPSEEEEERRVPVRFGEKPNKNPKSRKVKLFHREGHGSRSTLNMSDDLDAGNITRCTTEPTLECSEVSEISSQNASLSSISCGSYD